MAKGIQQISFSRATRQQSLQRSAQLLRLGFRLVTMSLKDNSASQFSQGFT